MLAQCCMHSCWTLILLSDKYNIYNINVSTGVLTGCGCRTFWSMFLEPDLWNLSLTSSTACPSDTVRPFLLPFSHVRISHFSNLSHCPVVCNCHLVLFSFFETMSWGGSHSYSNHQTQGLEQVECLLNRQKAIK